MIEGFASEALREISTRLDTVRQRGIRIGFAIESGSRAWGFPSPDSDYDCRFVYIRPVRDHLGLVPVRDVIEFPIIGDIDTGGWDLKKALLLALKGNAVIVEWVKSPLVYEEEPGFRQRLEDALVKIMVPAKVSAHYHGLLQRYSLRVPDEPVILKKLLYGIRPAITLEWMRQHSYEALPPMNLLDVLAQTDIPDDARTAILELVETKKVTREMGEGVPPSPLFDFMAGVDIRYRNIAPGDHSPVSREAEEIAGAFYRNEVARQSTD